MKVLFAYRTDVDLRGGAAIMLDDLAGAVRRLGPEVDVSFELEPDPTGYDLVHVFNIWRPETAIQQLRHLRAAGAPIVWNPIYSHWVEVAWARPAVLAVYGVPEGAQRAEYLKGIVDGRLEINGLSRWRFNEIEPGFHALLGEMLRSVDHVLVFSSRELQALSQVTRLVHKPFTVVPHGVSVDRIDAAGRDEFRAWTGIEGPFALCVGTLNGHKNQLLAVEALKGTGIRLVLLGSCFEPEYGALCVREGGDSVIHVDHLDRELVASAYKAAELHVQTSFAEGAAQVNLEAAVAGCPIVVSNRSSEYEYYGDLAYYCDPASPDSIREAVIGAWGSREREPERWSVLSERIRSHTWDRAAEVVVSAYERTLAARGVTARQAARKRAKLDTRAVVVAASLEELVAKPELLAAWGSTFTASDPVTLVVGTGELLADEAVARLTPFLDECGLGGDDSADVLVVTAPDEVVTAAADRLYGSRLAPPGDEARCTIADLATLLEQCSERRRLAWSANPRQPDPAGARRLRAVS